MLSTRITQNAFWIVLFAMALGLLIPKVSMVLRPHTFEFLFVVMVCALMRISPPRLDHAVGGAKNKMIKLLIWQLLITPIIVWAVVAMAGLSDGISTALIACACAGPVFSTPAFARLTGLDNGVTVQNLIIASLIMPLSLLCAGYFLLPVQPEINLVTFAFRVGIFLLIPFTIGFLYRKIGSENFQEKTDIPLLSISTLSLALMACSLMDGILGRIINAPFEMIWLVVLAIGFNICLQASTVFVFSLIGHSFAINAGLVCGYRNWALTLALTAGSLGPEFTTFVAIGQFGVMLLPLPTLRFYKKLLKL